MKMDRPSNATMDTDLFLIPVELPAPTALSIGRHGAFIVGERRESLRVVSLTLMVTWLDVGGGWCWYASLMNMGIVHML